jgi:hypothetical protein
MDSTSGGAQCIDPRYNYLADFWVPFMDADSQGTIGEVNDVIQMVFDRDDILSDKHYWLHIADEPLRSPAELSYIIRGADQPNMVNAAWMTLRLLDEGDVKMDPIYNCFVVTPNATVKAYDKGFVNPNTDVAAVLASAMQSMKLDRYPGDNEFMNTMLVSDASKYMEMQPLTLATSWINDPDSDRYTSKSTIMSNESFRTALRNAVNAISPDITVQAPAKEFRIEAGFRNLLDLMNPRQNYFIVILFAQSASRVQLPRVGDKEGAFVDTIRADQTALMDVWRDPVPRIEPNAGGGMTTNYPMLVRRFDILSQE